MGTENEAAGEEQAEVSRKKEVGDGKTSWRRREAKQAGRRRGVSKGREWQSCVNAACVTKEQRGWRDAQIMSEKEWEKGKSFQEKGRTVEIKEINLHELVPPLTPFRVQILIYSFAH